MFLPPKPCGEHTRCVEHPGWHIIHLPADSVSTATIPCYPFIFRLPVTCDNSDPSTGCCWIKQHHKVCFKVIHHQCGCKTSDWHGGVAVQALQHDDMLSFSISKHRRRVEIGCKKRFEGKIVEKGLLFISNKYQVFDDSAGIPVWHIEVCLRGLPYRGKPLNEPEDRRARDNDTLLAHESTKLRGIWHIIPQQRMYPMNVNCCCCFSQGLASPKKRA